MTRLACGLLLLNGSLLAASAVKVATFRVDATPPMGAPLIWVTPVERVADPLWAKGIVLESGGKRYVLCSVDWCGIGGSAHELLRTRMAAAARTEPANVELHVVHQHTAPYLEGDGRQVLSRQPSPPLLYPQAALDDLASRLASAVEKARGALAPVDSVGVGQAEVRGVASARRIRIDGKLVTRFSTSGKDPVMAAAPDGQIDPFVKTITLARGTKPIVRMHYYATHPQTFCCEGTVTADFVGAAREAAEKQDGVFQIYFTGAAGNVTVGKYNDGSVEKRRELEKRMLDGLQASIRASRFEPLRAVEWRTAVLELPRRTDSDPAMKAYRARLPDRKANPNDRYRAAIAEAFSKRTRPIVVSSLWLGSAVVVHLPGEPLLEFQNFAQEQLPGRFVAVAGYGDIAPGYICPDIAFEEGGYEPRASNTAPGAEAAMKSAIRKLLAPRP